MAAVVAGLADLRGRTEQRPRLPNVSVALTKVDAVGTEALGERHAVVDDEGDVCVGADPLQGLGKPRELMFADVLDAQLEGGRDPRLEGCLQAVGEGSANLLRADQI